MSIAQTPTVAEHLWSVLAELGVETVFGLPGTTTLAALEVLRCHNSMRFVVTRHEQCAGYMSDATARMGAPFGVTLVDLGPGLANTTTAILAAQRDSIPLLVVAGNEERRLINREVWHEMPELETYRALTKFAARLERGSDFPRLLRNSIAAMLGGRPGPALLSIPKDLWDEPTGLETAEKPVIALPIQPNPAAVGQAAALLAGASRPLILAGGGAKRAGLEALLAAFIERSGIPVVTSPNGRGVIAEDHPLCLGQAGRFGQYQASRTLSEADVVLVVGCQVNDLVSHNWALLSPGQTLIQVDTDGAMIGRNWPVALGVIADGRAFIEELAAHPMPSNSFWDLSCRAAERLATRKSFYQISDPLALKPQAVMGSLERQIPANHTVVMGGGRFQQFVGEWLVKGAKHFFYAANSGTVGYALSAAIGAAQQAPERTVVCCLGDGDFMMNVQEIETACRINSGLKVVVFNDFAYGAMKARQAVPFGTEYGNPPIDKLAQAFGAFGRTLQVGNEVEDAVTWLLSRDGVAVLDVHMDLTENRSLMYGHDIGDKT